MLSALAVIWGSIARGAAAVLRAVPWWGWTHALALALGGAAAVWGPQALEDQSAPGLSPRIGPVETVDTSAIRASVFERLGVAPAPDAEQTDTTCAVLPTWMSEGLGEGRNGLSHMAYDTDLLRQPRFGDIRQGLPWVAVPTRGGRRPAVGVTSEEVTLQGYNPKTGQGLTYTYAVPSPDWRLSVAGRIGGAEKFAYGESLLVLTRSFEEWDVSAEAGYGIMAGEAAKRSWQGGITIERTLLEWSF
jgi:hypothetical protein